jgi:DNA-binding NarL/FixJ family response regulator
MRVLIVDDHPLVADSIRQEVLRLRPRAEVRYVESLSAAETEIAEWGPPDAVLLDLNLPDTVGTQGLVRTRELLPTARIAVISGTVRPNAMVEAFARGANGFLGKGLSHPELRRGLERFLDTGTYYPPGFEGPETAAWPPKELKQLSRREIEAVKLVAGDGRRAKQLADEMGISENTFKSYYKSGYKKLRVRNRHEAFILLQQLGVLESQEAA